MKKGFDIFAQAMGITAFVADCIAIYLFIRGLFSQSLEVSSTRSISLVIVILLAFIFAISLIRYSGKESSKIFTIFGIIYAIMGAAIFWLASRYVLQGYNLYWLDIAMYVLIGIIVSIFAHVVTSRSGFDLRWASIPYILVSIIQIASVVLAFINGGAIPLIFFLFLVSEIIIISIFLANSREKEQSY